jgi:basic membrane protein A
MHRRLRSPFAAVVAVAALALTACGGGADEGSNGSGDAGETTKIAAMFSGPTNDNDYNALGLAALNAAKADGATPVGAPRRPPYGHETE